MAEPVPCVLIEQGKSWLREIWTRHVLNIKE